METYTFGSTLLSIRGVSKSYGQTDVLKDVDFEIKDVHRPGMTQGQVVALLGPSGIGKSTLLRLIAGLEAPTEGEILVGPEQKPTHAGLVGVVAQNYPLFEDRSVMDNLILGGLQGGLKKSEAIAKAREMLSRFGLEHRADVYPVQLSGGQRQRAAIAQQLLCSNHLLILDEPFSGLDPGMKDETCKIILEVSVIAEDMTIMLITHDLREALKTSDMVIMLGRDHDDKGRPLPGASPKTIYDLKAMGLAWHPDLTHSPEFMSIERQVRDEFKNL